MQLLLTCPACGEVVRIRAEDPGHGSRCPHCDHRFPAISIADDGAIGDGPRIDDAVVSWLSESPQPSDRDPARDISCRKCGYAGMIPGDGVCPVCLEGNPTQSPPAPPTVECPNCGRAIVLLHHDRGKTTICPGCKYFLGCVLPAPKPTHRKQPS